MVPLEETTNTGSLDLAGYAAYPGNTMTVVSEGRKRADAVFQNLNGTVTATAVNNGDRSVTDADPPVLVRFIDGGLSTHACRHLRRMPHRYRPAQPSDRTSPSSACAVTSGPAPGPWITSGCVL